MDRLFSQFQPEHYDIQWDLRQAKSNRLIRGTATIRGQHLAAEPIRLHAKDLQIEEATVNGQVAKTSTDNDILTLDNTDEGPAQITIEFSLILTDAMHGIYPCYYQHQGQKCELYATQFESHHAREAFPCVDEPEAKATFAISILSNEPVVLSNMPVVSQRESNEGTLTAFEQTPRMSTYLAAFVAGDLQRATAATKSGVEVNVYATPAQSADSLNWALQHAAQTIDFFNEYFGVPYPLPKSDHVALPDFSSGAMENWGLVTYRETALLADPATASVSTRQYIATVIAHELSHQWFGNLVTMKWWNNLWLNESFATLMEYLATDALHPDWRQWDEFANNEGVAALRRDSIDGVQPVQTDVSSPAEISALFDGAIVYAKGGRLLRMMQLWIGDEAFRAGLKQYFTRFKYGNTTGDDLWECLSQASGKDVGALMNTWISQPGYPVVYASLNNGELTLRQEQFFTGPHQPSDRLWPIPLGANDQRLPEIIKEREQHLSPAPDGLLLLNHQNASHFITCYDDTLRARILQAITDGILTPAQRAQYLNEQILLARGGLIVSSTLVEALAAFQNESDQTVWEIISLAISDLKKFVDQDEAAEKLLRRLSDSKLRAVIIDCMLYSEDAAAISTARQLYQNTPLAELSADLRPSIIGAAVRYSDQPADIVSQLLEAYQATQSADLRSDIAAGITATRDAEQLARLIGLLTDTDIIRSQDTVHWFVDLLRNRYGREAAWRWMRSQWHWIEQTFASDKSHDYFPRYAAMLLMTRQQLAEYREFFTPLRHDQSLVRAIDMGILDLEGKLDLIDRDKAAVLAALAK